MLINAANENITVISVMLIPAKQLNLLQEVQVTLMFWNSFEVLYHKLNFCTCFLYLDCIFITVVFRSYLQLLLLNYLFILKLY